MCDKYGLYLYADGARLGCALTAPRYPHLGYGTADRRLLHRRHQNGALFGEALVITRPELIEVFVPIKQRGGMMAKGRLLGIQFGELFRDNLYFDLARHANGTAVLLKNGLMGGGYEFLIPPISSILPNMVVDHLRQQVAFEDWQAAGDQGLRHTGWLPGERTRKDHGVFAVSVKLQAAARHPLHAAGPIVFQRPGARNVHIAPFPCFVGHPEAGDHLRLPRILLFEEFPIEEGLFCKGLAVISVFFAASGKSSSYIRFVFFRSSTKECPTASLKAAFSR